MNTDKERKEPATVSGEGVYPRRNFGGKNLKKKFELRKKFELKKI